MKGRRGGLDLLALRLSLTWGHGDVQWFTNLSREDKVAVMAFDELQREARSGKVTPESGAAPLPAAFAAAKARRDAERRKAGA